VKKLAWSIDMADIICPLYDLVDHRPLIERLNSEDICIRPARPWERTQVAEFIVRRFGQSWVDEAMLGFGNSPVSIVIALQEKKILGFAAYEVTSPGFFGPTGVDKQYRGRGIGKALLLESLAGLRSLGYVYGFIGAPGPKDFYLKATKSLVLPDDWTTIYNTTEGIIVR
jgi:ribosomal protein S18 acetylase RimI-like enzyme